MKEYKSINKPKKKSFDKTLFILTLILTSLGIIAVADASAPQALRVFNDSFYFARQQVVWSLVGFLALIIGSLIPYTIWKKISLPLFVGSILLLILVLIPGVGSKVLGARRWLPLGPFSFQPSEFVKFSLAIFFASLLEKSRPLWHFLLFLAIVSLLIMLQPDLGTNLIVVGIGFSQLFIAGVGVIKMVGI